MSVDDYNALVSDLASIVERLCQDSWLLDYYEGKNDGKAPTDYCAPESAPTK